MLHNDVAVLDRSLLVEALVGVDSLVSWDNGNVVLSDILEEVFGEVRLVLGSNLQQLTETAEPLCSENKVHLALAFRDLCVGTCHCNKGNGDCNEKSAYSHTVRSATWKMIKIIGCCSCQAHHFASTSSLVS
eukprot:m.253640 g.253640  ORF g.253640 m.253640 type:complete len:132 (+) comp15484_c0_seq1:1075-1470(+)